MIINKDSVKETNTLTNKINLPLKKCTDTKISQHALLSTATSDTYDNRLTVLNLWYDLDSSDENISVRLDSRIKGARKIGFNSRIIFSLQKDDKVQLPIINGEKYFLHIKNVKRKNDQDIELYGEMHHNGNVYASTLSFTKKATLALLSTPLGHFDVRIANDKGYIYQSNQLADIEAVVDLPSFLN